MNYNGLIDLRSDTVTKPCKKMRQSMYNAEVGDAYYNEDHVTKSLEDYCAEYFGTESALFTISGTMANQIALRCHTKPGDELITDNFYHIIFYESAATANLAGVVTNIIFTDDGILTEKHLNSSLLNRYRSNLTTAIRLIWLENTINHYAGKIYPLNTLEEVSNFAKKNKLAVHIDGARLLNASVATKTPCKKFASLSNSMTVSFSKGLGAPAGAVLLSDRGFIEQARRYQKWYGGGMHQSGILAAASLFAITNNIDYLRIDNAHAKLLAELLSQEEKLNVSAVETNMVTFSLNNFDIGTQDFVNLMKHEGVLLYSIDSNTIRAVTHKDVSEKCIMRAADLILKNLKLYKSCDQFRGLPKNVRKRKIRL
jgi:threonine aldolase